MHRWLLVSLLMIPFAVAQAADQPVRGTLFVIKSPSTPEKRKIVVKAKDAAGDLTLVGNPLVAGASLTLSADGATPSQATYTLPAGTSPTTAKPFWTGDAAQGTFTYRDAGGENGPVKLATIKRRNGGLQIGVALDGKRGPITVVPPNPGSAGCLLLVLGGGDSYSVAFASGRVTNKGTALFKIAKPDQTGSCLPPPTPTATRTATATATATPTPGLPDIIPPGDAPLRYRDLVFSSVSTTSDVIYGSAVNNSGQTVTLLLDIYEPAGDTVTERPAIVWIHGGSFCCGNKTSPEIVDEATTFARKGYFNVSISYRLEPGGCPSGPACLIAIQEALEDAQTAVRFLRDNEAVYGIDETRIAVAGTSAGAITALHVGFHSSEDPTAAVGAAVSLSGGKLIGTIDSGDAPSLLFHGTADLVVPYPVAVSTQSQANAAGLDSFLTSWPGFGHVPYAQHRTQILDQTTNFLYWELDLAAAAQ